MYNSWRKPPCLFLYFTIKQYFVNVFVFLLTFEVGNDGLIKGIFFLKKTIFFLREEQKNARLNPYVNFYEKRRIKL